MATRYYAVYHPAVKHPVNVFRIHPNTEVWQRMNARNTAAILSGINNVVYEVKMVEKVHHQYVECRPV